MFATKRSRAFVCAMVFAALFTVMAPSLAHAETKFAVLNFQSLMADSKAAKSIQKQLEDKRKSFQDEFSKHERELVEKEKSLVDKRSEKAVRNSRAKLLRHKSWFKKDSVL